MEMQLIQLAQSGNRDAFGKLVDLYSRKVYHTAYSILHNVDDAADIAQEVFIRAFRSISSFDVSRAFFPWLYRITKNLCLNSVKRANRRDVTLPVDDILPASSRSPENETMRNEEVLELQTAIGVLPDKFQEIVELKHFQECTYAEMAEILDIPIGTVMSRLYAAREKLKALLTEVNT